MHVSLLLLAAVHSPADPTAITKLAPRASGVALVEVVKVADYDARAADGPLETRIDLRILRSTGDVTSRLVIIKAYGGSSPPGAPTKPMYGKLKPDSLTPGNKYWIAFASVHDTKQPNRVINFWSGHDARVLPTLDRAVRSDHFQWRPQYFPKLGLSHGYRVNTDKRNVRIRVTKEGKTLWTKTIPGVRTERYFSQGFWAASYDGIPKTPPKSKHMLIIETEQELKADNEFNLPPKAYNVCTAFDPFTGQRLAVWISRNQVGHVNVLHRDYDPKTKKPSEEFQFDWLKKGGVAAGAKKEFWGRKIHRTFDAKGRTTVRGVYRWAGGSRYVKVKQP